MSDILASLAPEEQATLKLCGITQDAQLARTTPAALAQDLQSCRKHFPEQACDIPEDRLRDICAQAQQASGEAPTAQAPRKPRKEEEDDGLFFTRSCPPLVISSRRRSRSLVPGTTPAQPLSATNEDIEKIEAGFAVETEPLDRQERIGLAASYDYHNAVHNTHSIAVYLGAWATILIVADIAAVIIIPLLIILGFDISIDIRGTGFMIAVACALPYICFVSRAVCSVCRVRIFSFKKYSHNREAHWMPLLGYALPTALHIAFRFWFRCPACGSPQKLFRRPGSRRSK